jgi:hypothetical protein
MAKFRPSVALREHMLEGHPVSLLEAILLFGVQNPNAEFARMKKDGFLINSQQIPMAAVLRRMNKFTVCKPPHQLPYKEMTLKQYWVEL